MTGSALLGAEAPGTPPAGPVPRRVRPPRWLDLRLVLGVLLVLGSVLVGARVVTAAGATVPVWAAAGDLAAGTVLAPDDLVAVQVRLDDVAAGYLATSTDPAGQVLARAVLTGELLPRAALEPVSEQVQLALPVQAGYAPPGLARGQRVDVYAVADPAAGATDTSGEVSLVLAGAPVQAVSGRGEGVLSAATTTIQVVVGLAGDDVPGVLSAIGGRALVVVVRDGTTGTGPATGPTAPVPAPSAPAPVPTTAGPTG
ncbi:SAF domain-containing protein [Klenkia sp. PcliD-1-E]|uniref:SAF domain-containing protein n=1 Tax=Klenkia sp. PcliD-1-E TaxID=2954492 RepID=UPI002097D398|nr:SAF domain-containing protein [Klenkia sp. PcliD-1-E]MCO7220365.1 SAF domain-containing protein [Klenkia sp. PcliD-1-E]